MSYEAQKGILIKTLKELGKSKEEIDLILEKIFELEEEIKENEAESIYFEYEK